MQVVHGFSVAKMRRGIVAVAVAALMLVGVAFSASPAHALADQWETLGTYSNGSACFADANSNNGLGFPGHFTCATNGNGTWVQLYLDA